jgi:ketosteroid isomerase-like protein
MNKEEALLKALQNWDDALARNDLPAMERYMAPDWVIVGTGSGITSRADFLGSVISGDLVHSKMSMDESRIKIYGNMGIVTAKGTSEGTYKGSFFSLYEWSTSVFTWEGAGWTCVLTMLTPVYAPSGA